MNNKCNVTFLKASLTVCALILMGNQTVLSSDFNPQPEPPREMKAKAIDSGDDGKEKMGLIIEDKNEVTGSSSSVKDGSEKMGIVLEEKPIPQVQK